EQLLLLPLAQAAGDDHAPRAALLFQLQHLVDGRKRLGPRSLDEAAGVYNDEIGPIRLADELIAVQLQQTEHPLAIDEVFWAAEADEGVGAFGLVGCARRLLGFHGGGEHARAKPDSSGNGFRALRFLMFSWVRIDNSMPVNDLRN